MLRAAGADPVTDDDDEVEDDVMAELTKMISGQSSAATARNGGGHEAHDAGAPHRVEDVDGEEAEDGQWSEEDAIIRAMEALDEDLASTSRGGDGADRKS
jgi:hypothetical protein